MLQTQILLVLWAYDAIELTVRAQKKVNQKANAR